MWISSAGIGKLLLMKSMPPSANCNCRTKDDSSLFQNRNSSVWEFEDPWSHHVHGQSFWLQPWQTTVLQRRVDQRDLLPVSLTCRRPWSPQEPSGAQGVTKLSPVVRSLRRGWRSVSPRFAALSMLRSTTMAWSMCTVGQAGRCSSAA